MVTALGKSRRHYLARVARGWEHDYGEAIKNARRGKPERLVGLLRAHRPLEATDFEALADYLDAKTRRPGAPTNYAAHKAADLVEILKSIWRDTNNRQRVPAAETAFMIEQACLAIEQETGDTMDREAVKTLLDKPKSRRK